MYGSLAKVKALTNVTPQQLNQPDQASLDQLLTEWLEQATSVINGFLQRDLEAEVGTATALAAAAATGATWLTVDSTAVFGEGDRLWVGAGLTREAFEVSALDRSINRIYLDGETRYDHAAGEQVGRENVATAIPPAIHNCAERMVANMVGLATQRRTTPIVQTSDFVAQLSSDAVFTKTLKDDIRPWRRRPRLTLA